MKQRAAPHVTIVKRDVKKSLTISVKYWLDLTNRNYNGGNNL